MTAIVKGVSAIFLGLIFLIGSMGFTLSNHLCGGEIVKSAISLTKIELTCGMKKSENSCPGKNALRQACCQNEYSFHQVEDNEETHFLKLEFLPLTQRPVQWIGPKKSLAENHSINKHLTPHIRKGLSKLQVFKI